MMVVWPFLCSEELERWFVLEGVSFMLLAFWFALMALFVVLILKVAAYFISESVDLNREELSSYECGFEHHRVSRIPFSMRYFFLTLIFLLFDLEIVLLVFIPQSLYSSFFYFGVLVVVLFIFVLYLSLLYEWNDGTLEWLS